MPSVFSLVGKDKDMKKNIMKKVTAILITAFVMAGAAAFPVLAADVVTGKLNSLYDLVLGIITAAGVIVLAWGIFEFASAYQSRDTAQQTDSLKKVVSGIIMIGAPTIIGLLK